MPETLCNHTVLECLNFNSCTIDFMFYRKEVKDPDVLYNMLKNLLAQIKVKARLLIPDAHKEESE